MKAVLFDLDGTLLPMNQDEFIKAYFKGLSGRLTLHGYEPQAFLQSVWKGIGAMLKNDGAHTNEERFWEAFTSVYGKKALDDLPHFNAYYQEEFPKLKAVCGYHESAATIVKRLKEHGVRVVLATNPVFPEVATKTRVIVNQTLSIMRKFLKRRGLKRRNA